MHTTTHPLKRYISQYLSHRPAFFSFIRPQEAWLFHQHKNLLKTPVLDFGCGDGFFAELVFGKGMLDIGLDISPSRIQEADNKNIYKKLLTYDGLTIPLKDNSVNTVISNCVFEHLPHLHSNLREMYRVLKPGGKLLTTVMANRWEDYLIGMRIFGEAYQRFMRKRQEHFNLFSLDKWQKTHEKAGFTVEEMTGYLSQEASQWLDAFHYFSTPELVSQKLLRTWVPWPDWHKGLRLSKKLLPILMRSLQTKASESAALFIVVRK